jgi:transcriptional regulator with XRE-family HTH domain
MLMADQKLFAGPRIRRIRNAKGLTQTAMAEGLGISPSYLNLIERNQRPLTVQLVLKLASVYKVDPEELQYVVLERAPGDDAGGRMGRTAGAHGDGGGFLSRRRWDAALGAQEAGQAASHPLTGDRRPVTFQFYRGAELCRSVV